MGVRRRTKISSTFALPAALTALALMLPCAAASANPLLSGYGGPGQGSQTIIGSSLVNPPGGGSSGSSGGGSGSELTVAASQPSSSSATTKSAGARHVHVTKAKGSKGASTQAPTVPVSAVPTADLAHVSSSASGGTLGLSGSDILLVVFGLMALALTAVLTRRLTRRTP